MKNLELPMYIGFLFTLLFHTAGFSQKTQELNEEDLKTWWQKDLEQDTIPGISLERAYKELLEGKKGKEVVVAVLDTKFDVNHEDLKNQLWVNMGEIAANGIDDDENGYVDDVHGWNFLGNSKGDDVVQQHAEVTRIVKKYKLKYEKTTEDGLSSDEKKEYILYQKAKKVYDADIIKEKETVKYSDSLSVVFRKANDTVMKLLSRDNFDKSEVDSLAKVHSELKSELTFFMKLLDDGDSEKGLKEIARMKAAKFNLRYGLEVDERKLLNDDPHMLTDVPYGNNILINNELKFQHATPVSGLIAATRDNGLGINGISNSIRIMPVVMVAEGDENDKEVALAIRYAVDNGADIINMSWGKYFSLHESWVRDAIKYAAEHNVLLVSAAGNNYKNIDVELNYPNDNNEGIEFATNFIMVAGNTHKPDSTLVAWFSNYGKENVDLFAPAAKIYTTDINDGYKFTQGTSFASPITAGVAALLKSYYPTLTASELKQILMKSGTTITMDVLIPSRKKSNEKVPFSELSKSGKILNAYNALRMAESVSKSKD